MLWFCLCWRCIYRKMERSKSRGVNRNDRNNINNKQGCRTWSVKILSHTVSDWCSQPMKHTRHFSMHFSICCAKIWSADRLLSESPVLRPSSSCQKVHDQPAPGGRQRCFVRRHPKAGASLRFIRGTTACGLGAAAGAMAAALRARGRGRVTAMT